ncbi:unnamed protein product [Vitrella brassicaformis CCMP3155]|uniref:Cleavage stimulation factor 50 kDa subunit n=1 Tax=Vitrella brassicaformis (strain CCMP3155) TaxID=1169540 RepID=A0A0G4EJE0_VITBC|nr:unnamed protein product [Vitrella brassicaformis CCMP3155]|eukprot:CEL96864.1 unnamed protein product [Vitrella brassicaformis CCMP3155]
MPAAKIGLYELVLRQLQDDGFADVAAALSSRTHISANSSVPDDHLFQLYEDKLFAHAYGNGASAATDDAGERRWVPVPTRAQPLHTPGAPLQSTDTTVEAAMECKESLRVLSSRVKTDCLHHAHQQTGERSGVSVVVSNDGQFVASSGSDCTVRVMFLSKLRATREASPRHERHHSERVLTRVYEDHTEPATSMAFHPRKPYLYTGSSDRTVKIFETNKNARKQRSSGEIQEAYPIRCMAMHPCGDFLLVGTAHPIIRLYDVNTLGCFIAFRQDQHHKSSINDLQCTSDGSVFASASADGVIQIWDAVSNRSINRLPNAHRSLAVETVRWSRNLTYLLSAGRDGRTRLWDMRKGEEVFVFAGGSRESYWRKSIFLYDERYVASISTDPSVRDVLLFNAGTGEALAPLHVYTSANQPARCADVAASPTQLAVSTVGSDARCRYLELSYAQDDRRTD